ncbi:MAG: hypothetical protein DMF64_01205 [Acidobacteria bacterium]|nr:MAG: hypothetical protein DMF64_01205 [Acidobacteriota bacterium]
MPTREIPRAEWPAFFESFSRQHEGWLATVEVLGQEIGAQEEAHELPLIGITAELKGGDKDTVSIIVGKAADDHVTHTITEAAHVRLEQTASGADEALQIESASGAATLIRFRSAVLPEMVDGIVSE